MAMSRLLSIAKMTRSFSSTAPSSSSLPFKLAKPNVFTVPIGNVNQSAKRDTYGKIYRLFIAQNGVYITLVLSTAMISEYFYDGFFNSLWNSLNKGVYTFIYIDFYFLETL